MQGKGEQGGEGMGCREAGMYMGKVGNEGEHGRDVRTMHNEEQTPQCLC